MTNFVMPYPPRPNQRSSTTVYGPGKSYSYSNGVFYEPANHGYEIVQPPVGVLVESIPKGATTVTVNGANYLEFVEYGTGLSTVAATWFIKRFLTQLANLTSPAVGMVGHPSG
jgi:hypothetical protein